MGVGAAWVNLGKKNHPGLRVRVVVVHAACLGLVRDTIQSIAGIEREMQQESPVASRQSGRGPG